jgi:hypothetical protein
MPPIQSDHHPSLLGRIREDGNVRDSASGITRLLSGQDVVAKTTELLDDLEWKILVREEAGH